MAFGAEHNLVEIDDPQDLPGLCPQVIAPERARTSLIFLVKVVQCIEPRAHRN